MTWLHVSFVLKYFSVGTQLPFDFTVVMSDVPVSKETTGCTVIEDIED